MRTVLFHRDFRRFHGGHLKVWDYFNHVAAAAGFEPRISFSKKTRWDATNPWRRDAAYVVDDPSSLRPDVFFVAGRDWLTMDEHPEARAGKPVINLLQHIRHADPGSSRYEFLGRRAIRICVSRAVAEAIGETGCVEGPVVVIPDCVDLSRLPAGDGDAGPSVDLLIAGLKRPDLALELARRLSVDGRGVELLTDLLPRDEFLERVRDARVTVFLPNEEEGYYLPPLEGMALGTIVVCPRYRGEADIYDDGANGLHPGYTLDELELAANEAIGLDEAEAERLRQNARRTAEAHDISRERAAFHDILDHIDELW